MGDDRRILQHKVGQYYTGASLEESCANFARFVQVSAIGLIASHMAEYMSDDLLIERWFDPWVELARSLGFSELAESLNLLKARSEEFRMPLICVWHWEAGFHHDRSLLHRRLNLWFKRSVFPIVEAEKQRAVRKQMLFSRSLSGPGSPARAGLSGDAAALSAALQLFRHLDRDHSGSLDEKEFARVHKLALRRRAAGARHLLPRSADLADPAELFQRVDLDKSAGIQEDEWEMYTSAVFEALGRTEFLRFLGEYAAARGLYQRVRQRHASLRLHLGKAVEERRARETGLVEDLYGLRG